MHWRNSWFQIRHFLAGKAHTPDEAYRVLRELEEEREDALKAAEVNFERLKARMAELQVWWRGVLMWFVPSLRLRSKADVMELTHNVMRMADLVVAANQELAHIRILLAEVEPLRRYRHLPEHEAHQAAQADEWLLELQTRVENYLMGMGTIPPEQLDVMRLHPAWESSLLPHVQRILTLCEGRHLDKLPARGGLLVGGPT